MNKKVLITLLLLMAVIIGTIIFISNRSEAPVVTSSNQTSQNQFSVEEVAQHTKVDDCWTIINGGVYNITNYVPMHPGGDEILRTCGTDGSSLFTERKTDSGELIGSGTPHSNTAENQLSSYKIGELSR